MYNIQFLIDLIQLVLLVLYFEPNSWITIANIIGATMHVHCM